MKSKGVEPNVVTFTAVISACASACAKKYNDDEVGTATDFGKDTNSDNRYENRIKATAMKAALSILAHMTREEASLDIKPNIVTYNAAIRACAEGLDVDKAFALFEELKRRNLQPTIVTFGTLMTACERVDDTDGATKVFRLMKDTNMEPNEIVYGAAISCFRKASQSEQFRLLRQMLDGAGGRRSLKLMEPDTIQTPSRHQRQNYILPLSLYYYIKHRYLQQRTKTTTSCQTNHIYLQWSQEHLIITSTTKLSIYHRPH